MNFNDSNKIGAFILALWSYPELSEKINECAVNNNDISSVRKILENLQGEYAESLGKCADFWEEKLNSSDNAEFEELKHEYNKRVIAENPFMIGKKCEYLSDTIIERIKHISERFPDKIAVTDKDTNISYGEFWRRVSSCACYLEENGVNKNDVVALEVCNSAETVVRMTAIMLLGAAYIPFDAKSPYERKKYMINEGGASFVMPLDGNVDYGKKLICFTSDPYFSGSTEIRQEHSSYCYTIFTSGTTGKPKGISIREQQLENLLEWYSETLKIDGNTVFFAMHSFAFDTMFKNTYAALCAGGRIMINYDNEYDFSRICSYIKKNKCTHIKSNASVFNALLNAARDDGYKSLSSVKYLFLGGDKFVGENIPDFIHSREDKLYLLNAYGPTEAADTSAYHFVTDEELAVMQEKAVPIGIPIDNQNIYTVSENGFVCGKGVEGEIVIGGVGVAEGYAGSGNSESFSRNLIRGDRTYSSGDYGWWNEKGELVFSGRKDDMIKLHGYRVFLSEIENAAKNLSAVAETKAVYTNDMIILFCRSSESCEGLDDKLRAVLAEHIASYMMPSRIIFLDEFPRTLNGKTDIEKLCTLAVGPESETEIYSGEIQKRVSDIWSSILKHDSIAPNVSFFDAGGNSLNLFMLSKKIEKEFSVKIKPVKFIEISTIRLISELIETML